ncbi:MAG: DUF5312 family protein [Spirochaetes bacterium]|nr:DUF5312 family protein [Spirochaetota bacterium]
MSLWTIITDYWKRLLGGSSHDTIRKAEIRKLQKRLEQLKPPYYRIRGSLVLPGFAQAVYSFALALRPLVELVHKTVANADLRVSQKYYDYLIDCNLPPEEQDRKKYFSYDDLRGRVERAIRTDEEFDAISAEFKRFADLLSSLNSASGINGELVEMDRFIEICKYDWERVLGFFDPGINMDDSRRKPDFQPSEGGQLLAELMDVYYLLADFSFDPPLGGNVLRILERHSSNSAGEDQRRKIDKIFAALNKVLAYRLDREILLSLIRILKDDPLYEPVVTRERRDFVDLYRKRLSVRFDQDRERVRRELHENAIASDIVGLFGDMEILQADSYDEETDAFLRKETPYGFTHVKPLRILKTFVFSIFEPKLKEPIKKILVEGYFDDKVFQNNLANILFQCERTVPRIVDFEDQFSGTGRMTASALRRYVEELRHGKDVLQILQRLVDGTNERVRDICEDEAGLYKMLSDAIADLVKDYRRSSPDLVTNIRSMGGARNKEIMGQVIEGKRLMDLLVHVMKNFMDVNPPGEAPVATVDELP